MRRRLLNLLAVLSLLSFVAVAALWVRSHFATEAVGFGRVVDSGAARTLSISGAGWARGRVVVVLMHDLPSELSPEYAGVLARHGAGHVYNYWSAMPMPAEQAGIIPPESLPHAVMRLLLPPGTRYEQQREAFRPFDRLQAPDPAMRQQVVEIARRASGRGSDVFVLVNNKAEGSSPLTVMEIARLLASEPRTRNP